MQWNLMELSWLQALHDVFSCAFLDVLMPIVSLPGNGGIGFILLAAVLLCIPKTRRLGACMAFSLLCDVLLVNMLIKPLVCRVRPFALGVSYPLLVSAPGDASFPSGHTAAAFASAFALRPAGRKVFLPMAGFAVLIGLSRLYLMVHYPTDVLVGAICGAVCGLAGVWLENRCHDCRLRRHTNEK